MCCPSGAEAVVEALLCEELLVGAAFEDLAVGEDEDLVGIADQGAQFGQDGTQSWEPVFYCLTLFPFDKK
jgi:hypothetical protein